MIIRINNLNKERKVDAPIAAQLPQKQLIKNLTPKPKRKFNKKRASA